MKKGFVVGLVRVAVLSSGGKDSTYAHWWAILQGWDVISLIRCKIRTGDSMTFQVPATDIVEKQSLASETNYIEFVLSGEENSEMEELASLISENMRKDKTDIDNYLDLDQWENFEKSNPDFFSGMYQFWSQKI